MANCLRMAGTCLSKSRWVTMREGDDLGEKEGMAKKALAGSSLCLIACGGEAMYVSIGSCLPGESTDESKDAIEQTGCDRR